MFFQDAGQRAATADDQAAQSLLIAQFRREFPEFRFATQTTWSGISILAIRLDGAEGMQTLITADPVEMHAELASSRTVGIVPDGHAADQKRARLS